MVIDLSANVVYAILATIVALALILAFYKDAH